MGLNASKGNMYSWVTHTWNTVKGECPHGCTYCYMRRWGKQKNVRFDDKEMNTDLGSGNFIFVGSSCDLFAAGIPDFWILKTLQICEHFNNKYLFQTKNPVRFLDYIDACVVSDKSVFCTTIETNRWYPAFMKKSPHPELRSLNTFRISEVIKTYVTIEPIMDFDLIDLVGMVKQCNPAQVNIGADSGNNGLPEPSPEKLMQLIEALKEFTVIDQKKNLQRLLKF